jgi:hypothetical protein
MLGLLGFPPRPSGEFAMGIAPPGRGAMLKVKFHWS